MKMFNVGDIVRGIANKNITKGEVISVGYYADEDDIGRGTIDIKILEYNNDRNHKYVGHTLIALSPCYFELVNEERNARPIIIYNEGDKMIAVDTNTGNIAEVICSPNDKFDYRVGAELAFKRLMGDPNTFKVRCVEYKYSGKLFERYFTKGKVYTWRDGVMKSDIGYEYKVFVAGEDIDKWTLSRYYTFEKVDDDAVDEIEFSRGDIVTVMNTGYAYPSYDSWSYLKDLRSHFVSMSTPVVGETYEVVRVAPHNDAPSIALAAIRNPRTTQVFIIDVKGLKLSH